jgi:hypothetical protein
MGLLYYSQNSIVRNSTLEEDMTKNPEHRYLFPGVHPSRTWVTHVTDQL